MQLPVSGDDVKVVAHPRHGRLAQLVEERVRIGTILVAHRLGPGGFRCHHGVLSPLYVVGLFGRYTNSAARSVGS